MRDDLEWLLDILEAMGRNEKHSSMGRGTQNSGVHYQQIIGEVLGSISEKFRK